MRGRAVDAFVADLTKQYDIRDYADSQSFIGMEIQRHSPTQVTVTQEKYLEQMADRFQLKDAYYVATPMETTMLTANDGSPLAPDPTLYRAMVGSLMYAMCLTQPGLMYVAMALSRHLAKPTTIHVAAAQRAITWAYHHRHLGITYDGNVDPLLAGYTRTQIMLHA